MKNTFLILILLSSISILFYSCRKDSYDCVNGSCEAVRGGNYLTLVDCQSQCGNSGGTPSYDCVNGSCINSSDGSGYYSTYSICESSCGGSGSGGSGSGDSGSGGSGSGDSGSGGSGSGSVETYNCINGVCIDPNTGLGIYGSLALCESMCSGGTIDCENSFELSNNDYDLDGLTEVIDYGNFYNSFTTNYELRFFSPSITGGIPNYNGIGNMIYLNLHTNGTINGSYSFNSNTFNPSLNTWDGGYLANENIYNYSIGMLFPISAVSGGVTISDLGGGYIEATFNITTSNGLVTGCYSGIPLYYDTDGGSGGSGGSGDSGSGSGGMKETDSNFHNPALW